MAHEGWKCGDCGNDNFENEAKCLCGNPRPMHVNVPDGKPHGACAATNCPMTGTFADSVRGSKSWWCRWHWDYRGDYAHSARITEDLIANRPKIQGCKPNGEYVGID